MAKDFSFDIVSDYDVAEMNNAVDQTQRELATRYDFRATSAKVEFLPDKTGIQIEGDSRNQLTAIIDVLQSKLIRRGISLKTLDLSAGPVEAGLNVKQIIKFQKGLDQDKTKQITKLIRDLRSKSKTQVQGDSVRVSSASKDELQTVMAQLKAKDFDFPLSFTNYR